MLKPVLAAAVVVVLMGHPAWGTSWGLNSFSDSVYWSDAIIIGKVRSVKRVQKPNAPKSGKHGGYVDVAVQVSESLKGALTGELDVTQLDLGDATLNASPSPPLPTELVGAELFLLLRRQGNKYEAYSRGVIQDGKVRAMAFQGMRERSLQDIRAMVGELLPIQKACPRDSFSVNHEAAALAACRTAISSKHSEVVWYGARRLLDRSIPKDFVDDLAAVTRKEKDSYPVRYLLVQCLAKTEDLRAVPTLIGILRQDPKDINAPKALRDLTGQNFGNDAGQWESWWDKR